MRKILSLIAAAVLCAGMLSGCTVSIPSEPSSVPSAGDSEALSATDVSGADAVTTAPPVTTTTQPPVSAGQQALLDAQERIAGSGELVGIAYLGYCEGDFVQIMSWLEEQDHRSECRYIDLVTEERFVAAEGAELYAVIPAGEGVVVTVSEYAWMDAEGEYAPAAGNELLTVSDGQPVLLRCNISDIMSNLQITVSDGSGRTVTTNPCLSLEDGMLDMLSGGVCDLTPYDKMPQFSYVEPAPDALFCGTWFCEEQDLSGEDRTMVLTLGADGSAEYTCGIGNSEILASYSGTWSDDGSMLTLDMQGGPEGTVSFVTLYLEWRMTHEGLELTHIAGDVLLEGTENETLVFTSLY